MSELRETIAAIIGSHEGRCENPWNLQTPEQCADRILAIPEISSALYAQWVNGLVEGVGQRLGKPTWLSANPSSQP